MREFPSVWQLTEELTQALKEALKNNKYKNRLVETLNFNIFNSTGLKWLRRHNGVLTSLKWFLISFYSK